MEPSIGAIRWWKEPSVVVLCELVGFTGQYGGEINHQVNMVVEGTIGSIGWWMEPFMDTIVVEGTLSLLNHTGGWNQISIKVDGGWNHQVSKVVDGTTGLEAQKDVFFQVFVVDATFDSPGRLTSVHRHEQDTC